jgi:hypothetical protein
VFSGTRVEMGGNRMSKLLKKMRTLILIISLSIIQLIPAFAQDGNDILILSAFYSHSSYSVAVSGTTHEDVLAVAVLLYDVDSENLLRMETFKVVDGRFSGSISIRLFKNGIYTIKAANYEGGKYKEAAFSYAEPPPILPPPPPPPPPPAPRPPDIGSGSLAGENYIIINPPPPLQTAFIGAPFMFNVERDDILSAMSQFEGNGTPSNLAINMQSPPPESWGSPNEEDSPLMLRLQSNSIDDMVSHNVDTLQINTDFASIQLGNNVLNQLNNLSERDVTVSMESVYPPLDNELSRLIGIRPIIRFEVRADGEYVSDFDEPIKLTIDYEKEISEKIEALLIYKRSYSIDEMKEENEKLLIMSNYVRLLSETYYNLARRHFVIDTNSLSDFMVGYNEVNFSDVKSNDEYFNAVTYIAARGITAGTGNSMFSPNSNLTRSEFLVLLMRAFNIETDNDIESNFVDAGNTWYTTALATAKKMGISSGIGNDMFAPTKEITRQEMFAMITNVLRVTDRLPETDGVDYLTNFEDKDQIAKWAIESIRLLVEINAIDNISEITPTSTATRADAAQLIYNLLSN